MNNKPKQAAPNSELTDEEMKACLQKAGYFLEGSVKEKFQNQGFTTYSSTTFIDRHGEKVRELDLEAYILEPVFNSQHCYLGYLLACECKSKGQPFILFKDKNQGKASNELTLHVSGHPKSIDGNPIIDLGDIFGFHRYWNQEICFQYCSFKKSNNGWVAGHDDEDHDAFRALIQGLRQRIKEDDERWKNFPFYIRLAYPVFIVRGRILLAEESKGEISFTETKHSLFRVEDNLGVGDNPGIRQNYFVDIVSEDYLDEWIKKLKTELSETRRNVEKKKNEVLAEITKRGQHVVPYMKPIDPNEQAN
jgi:hypothetical protein